MITALVKGYLNGFIVAVFSVIALMVGLAAAMKLSTVVAVYLKDSGSLTNKWLPILSFIIVFLAALLIVRLGAAAIQKGMELVMLGWLNRLAGIALYAMLYTIILSVVLFYAGKINVVTPESFINSYSYPFIQPWGPKAINSLGIVVPFFKNMFHQLEAFFTTVAPKQA